MTHLSSQQSYIHYAYCNICNSHISFLFLGNTPLDAHHHCERHYQSESEIRHVWPAECCAWQWILLCCWEGDQVHVSQLWVNLTLSRWVQWTGYNSITFVFVIYFSSDWTYSYGRCCQRLPEPVRQPNTSHRTDRTEQEKATGPFCKCNYWIKVILIDLKLHEGK